ncbi:MAG: hypothetical protein DRR03_09485 [Gammaproteobacteria bacterium]|nr:MAG: hypothetical protein DRR03_09485 [Gammaproteobacteria bacterium]
MGGWGCPHERRGQCMKVTGRGCDPGMRGCVLYGRFVFSHAEKNSPGVLRRKRRRLDGSRIDD